MSTLELQAAFERHEDIRKLHLQNGYFTINWVSNLRHVSFFVLSYTCFSQIPYPLSDIGGMRFYDSDITALTNSVERPTEIRLEEHMVIR